MPPPVAISTRPLPPCSRRFRISSLTCRFHAQSNSPVWSTARAAEAASPPPFISIVSKNGPVGHVVVRVELAADDVARTEVDELVGAGADGLEVVRRFAGLVALVRLEEMLRDDHPARGAERVRPERRRSLEDELHSVGVDLLDLVDVPIRAARHGRRRGIGRVLPVEDDVVRGEGLAVVPGDVPLELPRHGLAVLGDAAVLGTRNLGGEDGEQVAVRIEGGERLVEDARAVLVLGADGEMRVEQRRRLPPQHLERAAAAAFGGLVGGRRYMATPPMARSFRGHAGAVNDRQHALHEALTDARPDFTRLIRPRRSLSFIEAPCGKCRRARYARALAMSTANGYQIAVPSRRMPLAAGAALTAGRRGVRITHPRRPRWTSSSWFISAGRWRRAMGRRCGSARSWWRWWRSRFGGGSRRPGGRARG